MENIKIINKTFYIENDIFNVNDVVSVQYKTVRKKTEIYIKKGIKTTLVPPFVDINVLINQYMTDAPTHDFKKDDILLYENKLHKYVCDKSIDKICITTFHNSTDVKTVLLSKVTKAIPYYFISSKGIVQSDFIGCNPEREFFCKKFGIYFDKKIDAYKKLDEVLK